MGLGLAAAKEKKEHMESDSKAEIQKTNKLQTCGGCSRRRSGSRGRCWSRRWSRGWCFSLLNRLIPLRQARVYIVKISLTHESGSNIADQDNSSNLTVLSSVRYSYQPSNNSLIVFYKQQNFHSKSKFFAEIHPYLPSELSKLHFYSLKRFTIFFVVSNHNINSFFPSKDVLRSVLYD